MADKIEEAEQKITAQGEQLSKKYIVWLAVNHLKKEELEKKEKSGQKLSDAEQKLLEQAKKDLTRVEDLNRVYELENTASRSATEEKELTELIHSYDAIIDAKVKETESSTTTSNTQTTTTPAGTETSTTTTEKTTTATGTEATTPTTTNTQEADMVLTP